MASTFPEKTAIVSSPVLLQKLENIVRKVFLEQQRPHNDVKGRVPEENLKRQAYSIMATRRKQLRRTLPKVGRNPWFA